MRPLNARSVVLLHKTRETATETRITHLVGDVRDRPCLIVDDMISTGGTIADATRKLNEAGARGGVFVAATHGLLLAGARAHLEPVVADVFVTDTVEHPADSWPGVHLVSMSSCLAEAIRRIVSPS